MEHIGSDLGSKESQVCVRNGVGEIVEENRCRTVVGITDRRRAPVAGAGGVGDGGRISVVMDYRRRPGHDMARALRESRSCCRTRRSLGCEQEPANVLRPGHCQSKSA